MPRYAMLLDTKTCIGCLACTLACKVEHNNPPGVWTAPVISEEIGNYPDVHRVSLPLMCMHCEDAPCITACPTGAIWRRQDGIVVVDADVCCGSGACVVACPHGAIQLPRRRAYYTDRPTPFDDVKGDYFPPGTAQKCDLCAPRVDRGLVPACVEACPTESRIFGDMDDPNGQLSVRLNAEESAVLQTGAFSRPSVRYTTDGFRDAGADAGHLRLPYRAQTVWDAYHACEFTLLGAGGGLAVVTLLTGGRHNFSAVLLAISAALVALGGLVLIYDLGRPLRFLRALRNQSTSWISRGALADLLFLALAVVAAVVTWRSGRGLNDIFVLVLAALGLFVGAYPALAMAALRSVPLWRGSLAPAVFVLDGLSIGVGITGIAVAAAGSSRGVGPEYAAFSLALLIGAWLRGALMGTYAKRLNRRSPESLPAWESIRAGRARRAWRFGTLGVGTYAAGLFALVALSAGEVGSMALALATACTLVGSASDKLVFLRTGTMAVQTDPGVEDGP